MQRSIDSHRAAAKEDTRQRDAQQRVSEFCEEYQKGVTQTLTRWKPNDRCAELALRR